MTRAIIPIRDSGGVGGPGEGPLSPPPPLCPPTPTVVDLNTTAACRVLHAVRQLAVPWSARGHGAYPDSDLTQTPPLPPPPPTPNSVAIIAGRRLLHTTGIHSIQNLRIQRSSITVKAFAAGPNRSTPQRCKYCGAHNTSQCGIERRLTGWWPMPRDGKGCLAGTAWPVAGVRGLCTSISSKPSWTPIPVQDRVSLQRDMGAKICPPPPCLYSNTCQYLPILPPPSKRQARNTARKLRKLQKAEELQEVLQDLSDSAIPLVYTDGSSAVEGHAGRVAGYGIFCEKQTSIAAFVPDEYRQTNNSAELLAVIRALRIFSTGDIAICTDSQYVVLGATSAARRWRLRGWIGLCGPVSNVPLWEQLLAALDENPRTVHWVKVPSHVTIEGNNEADRLADQGRQLHPRFPHPRTPSLLLSVAGTPRAPKKPKLLTLDRSPLPVKRLNFGAQASPPLIHSIEGQAVLTTLNVTLMADALSTTSDIRHCDTDSWSAESTDSASQLSSGTCST